MNVLKVIIILLLIPLASAQSLDSYDAKYTIVDQEVLVDTIFEFNDHEETILFYSLPSDVREVSVFLDGVLKDIGIIGHQVDIPIGTEIKDLRVIYLTKNPLERSRKRFFVEDIMVPYDTSRLEVTLTLPEKAILDKSVEEGGAVFPDPDELRTDGQRISLVWVRENLDKGDDLPLFVIFREGDNLLVFAIPGVVLLVLIGLYYWRYHRPKGKVETKVKTVTKKIPELHLKEDERIIVRILQKKEGKCYQSTLVLLSNFSKAHLSRILQEMEERGIIKKVQKGKKNIVILKSKEWDFEEV